MKKIKGGKVWTFPKRVQFRDLTLVTALESYLDLLLTRARCGRDLTALSYSAYRDLEKIKSIESDRSLRKATRDRLIRECDASIGAALRISTKYGTTKKVTDVMSKNWPRQSNQLNVFNSYRTVLRREGRPPRFREWVEQDYADRPLNVSCEIEHNRKKKKTWIAQRNPKEQEKLIRAYKRKRGNVIREMQKRFNLPVTRAS